MNLDKMNGFDSRSKIQNERTELLTTSSVDKNVES